ncbi:cytochrome c [Palleronia aestuarii]|uniref:Cytochrome c n=1 Tax=Palleronia aestuarii TaxID=568105 RepID=A0A2W7MYA3_9RHOB|nr:c-type cytochrome [Palleronia aestuarii]PZX12810.1 cytochrome c [Palleronia aestuarii]
MSKSLETVKILVPALTGTAALLALSVVTADHMVHRPSNDVRPEPGIPVAVNGAKPEEVAPEAPSYAGLATPANAQEASGTNAPADDIEGTILSRDGGFGLGREALLDEIAAWDIDIRPDGQGLPEGSGDVWTGEEVWVENCAMCHGDFGEAVGRWPVIAGGWDTLARKDPVKTVGSYWPYLSTVYDYIHRAMPFGNAQSLEPDQVYALTAYILYLNNIVEDDFVLSKETFADVEMPNTDGFFMDDRAETELEQWRTEPCMEACKDAVEITMHAAVLDVTPGTDEKAVDEAASAPAEAVSDTDMAAEGNATSLEVAEADAETVSEEGVAATSDTEAAPDEVAALDPELVEAGEGVFRKCQACHAVGEGASNKVGPQLNGVVGRTMGDAEGFKYSSALQEANSEGRIWNEETLAAFLEDPRGYLPGNKMSFRGLPKVEDREAIIAFLASHGD